MVSFQLAGDHATLWYSDPPIQEEVGGAARVWIDGHAEGAFNGGETELPFDGYMSYCESGRDNCVQCRSQNHRLKITN